MFGRKKMYKKGLADAMRAYEAFGRKQEEALAHIREEVRAGNKKLEDALAELGDDINGIYDYLTSKEKAALYHLSTPMDIKDLKEPERQLLMAVLYQLADDEGPAVTEEQRAYIRAVQRYLEVTNPETQADLDVVGEIDSLEVQKAFYQVTLEFFYLADEDELTDQQDEFQNNFSLNAKQVNLIDLRVSRLYNAMSAKGLAEKYGYVPEEETISTQKENGQTAALVGKTQFLEMDEDVADSLFDGRIFRFPKSIRSVVDTENYCYFEGLIVDKKTGEMKSFALGTDESLKVYGVPDTVCSVNRRDSKNPNINILNLVSGEYKTFSPFMGSAWPVMLSVTESYAVWCANKEIFLYNLKSQENKKVPLPYEMQEYCSVAAVSGKYLYLIAKAYPIGYTGHGDMLINIINLDDNAKSEKQIRINLNRCDSPIYLMAQDGYLYLTARGDLGTDECWIGQIDTENGNIEHLAPYGETVISPYNGLCTNMYEDWIFYALGHTNSNYDLNGINLATGENITIAKDILHLNNDRVTFRIGSWIYFKDKKSGSYYKVNLNNPGSILPIT